jgi:hypothetical protein
MAQGSHRSEKCTGKTNWMLTLSFGTNLLVCSPCKENYLAAAKAEARAKETPMLIDCLIPPITDPLGKYWDQPDREEVLVDDRCALMSQNTFAKLMNYETSNPSGVYTGKMWRRGMTLCWFSDDADPKLCKNNYRDIIIIEIPDPKQEIERLRALNAQLIERVAGQSELLSKRAEKPT